MISPRPYLTAREQRILDGVAAGQTSRVIAARLNLAPRSVDACVGQLLIKLDARNRAHAVAVAHAHGLLLLREGG